MIHYADMTFCPGNGCQAKHTCPRHITAVVEHRAAKVGLPIARFTDHKKLPCFVKAPRKKPECKHAFKHATPAERLMVCQYASVTTSRMAAAKYGRSDGMVRRWMRDLGFARRRRGNLTNQEVMAIKEAA